MCRVSEIQTSPVFEHPLYSFKEKQETYLTQQCQKMGEFENKFCIATQPKVFVRPRPSHKALENCEPPSCVTSFMNAPLLNTKVGHQDLSTQKSPRDSSASSNLLRVHWGCTNSSTIEAQLFKDYSIPSFHCNKGMVLQYYLGQLHTSINFE